MFDNLSADLRRSIANRKGGTWKQHRIIKRIKALGNLAVWPILAYRLGHCGAGSTDTGDRNVHAVAGVHRQVVGDDLDTRFHSSRGRHWTRACHSYLVR